MILDDILLNEIENAKDMVDKSRLPNFIDALFLDMEQQANEYGATSDEDNSVRVEVVDNYQKAWDHAVKNQTGEFNTLLLRTIAALVEPCQAINSIKIADFRSTNAYGWNDVQYCPPCGKDRIITHLGRMDKVLSNEHMHPFEEAIFTFYHIARIQPFEHGNKRTANIMMNSLLKNDDFAPIIFKDQQKYRRLLSNAVKAFKIDGAHSDDELFAYRNPGTEQLAFFSYVANIELSQLKTMRNILKGLNSYEVNITSKCPSCQYTVKRKIDSWFKSQSAPHKLHLSAKSGKLNIIGDIPYQTLYKIIDSSSGIQKFDINYNGEI
jgi:Fic family protein